MKQLEGRFCIDQFIKSENIRTYTKYTLTLMLNDLRTYVTPENINK